MKGVGSFIHTNPLFFGSFISVKDSSSSFLFIICTSNPGRAGPVTPGVFGNVWILILLQQTG